MRQDLEEAMWSATIWSRLGLKDPGIFAVERMRRNLSEARVAQLGAREAQVQPLGAGRYVQLGRVEVDRRARAQRPLLRRDRPGVPGHGSNLLYSTVFAFREPLYLFYLDPSDHI